MYQKDSNKEKLGTMNNIEIKALYLDLLFELSIYKYNEIIKIIYRSLYVITINETYEKIYKLTKP